METSSMSSAFLASSARSSSSRSSGSSGGSPGSSSIAGSMYTRGGTSIGTGGNVGGDGLGGGHGCGGGGKPGAVGGWCTMGASGAAGGGGGAVGADGEGGFCTHCGLGYRAHWQFILDAISGCPAHGASFSQGNVDMSHLNSPGATLTSTETCRTRSGLALKNALLFS